MEKAPITRDRYNLWPVCGPGSIVVDTPECTRSPNTCELGNNTMGVWKNVTDGHCEITVKPIDHILEEDGRTKTGQMTEGLNPGGCYIFKVRTFHMTMVISKWSEPTVFCTAGMPPEKPFVYRVPLPPPGAEPIDVLRPQPVQTSDCAQ